MTTLYTPKSDSGIRNLFYSNRHRTYGAPLYMYDIDDTFYERTNNDYDDIHTLWREYSGTKSVLQTEEKHSYIKTVNLSSHQLQCFAADAKTLGIKFIVLIPHFFDANNNLVSLPTDIPVHFQYYFIPVNFNTPATRMTEYDYVKWLYTIRNLPMPVFTHLSTTLKEVNLPSIIR